MGIHYKVTIRGSAMCGQSGQRAGTTTFTARIPRTPARVKTALETPWLPETIIVTL